MPLKGPAKANNNTPDGSTVIVMDLSFKYLGRHLDFGVRFGGTFLYRVNGTKAIKI
jgi:hypothetical protein